MAYDTSKSKEIGGIMRRHIKQFDGKFEKLQRHKTYMELPETPEEEPGTHMNEDVESETFNVTSYSPEIEELASDSDEGLHDYESLDGSESSQSNEEVNMPDLMAIFDIGDGVQMVTTKTLSGNLNGVRAAKWTTKERNSSLYAPNMDENIRFVSPNVYKISFKSNNKVTDVCNKSERKLPPKKRSSFSLSEKFKGKVSFRVHADPKYILQDDVCKYYAWVECGQEWKLIPAVAKGGYFEFTCDRLNSFGIVSCPKTINHMIQPSGSSIVADKLIAEFEPGSVEVQQKLEYSIQRPEQQYLKQSNNPKRLVSAASNKINIICDKSEFRKPMNLSGSLQSDIESSSDFESTIKIVSYQNKLPVIMDTIPEGIAPNHYKGKVDCSDGIAIIAFKNSTYGKDNFYEKLKDELDLVYGIKMECHILLFYVKKGLNNKIDFVAECCLSQLVSTVLEKYKQKGNVLLFHSDELYLPPHQRIRIRPTGCLELKAGRDPHFFLFFMYVASDNTVDFSLVINRRMGMTADAIIEFSADNQKRGVITQAAFSLDHVSHKIQNRPQLSRSTTSLSSYENFRKPNADPVQLKRQNSSTVLQRQNTSLK